MTDTKSTPPMHLNNIHRQFATALADSLRAAGQAGGSEWESSLSAPNPAQSSHEALTVALPLTGDLRGEIFLSVDESAAKALLSETDAAPASWLKLVDSSRATLAQALEPSFGTVRVGACRLITKQESTQALAALTLRTTSTGSEAAIHLHTDSLLGAFLERLSAVSQTLAENEGAGDHLASSGKLKRVIDVPLAVTLRFGQRQLTVRELLALTTGSLVELDRQVEEPVDLMLGERVIARGEVVIVDGNYGLRVLEILEGTPQRLTAQAAGRCNEELQRNGSAA